eukprot:350471-Chlamydomonas_euryale.AAC.1
MSGDGPQHHAVDVLKQRVLYDLPGMAPGGGPQQHAVDLACAAWQRGRGRGEGQGSRAGGPKK